jgi:TRAP-type mannitol/chloroaromatic compound transport system substrate-binding protein
VRPAEHGQLQRELNALYRDRLKLKVHALACGAHGAEGMWFKKPVNTPVELKALRLRTVGISHVLAEKLGMKPNAIYEPAKTIEALEGGALDATEFGQPWYDEGLRFHRVARHFYYPGWHAPAYMWQLEINLDRWNEMSQAQKGLIGEACRQNIAQAVREYAANAKAALDKQGPPAPPRSASASPRDGSRQIHPQTASRLLKRHREHGHPRLLCGEAVP